MLVRWRRGFRGNGWGILNRGRGTLKRPPPPYLISPHTYVTIHNMPLDVLLEGFLFYKAAPQKKQTIIKLFTLDEADFNNALETLKERLQTGATRLLETETEVQLVTTPEMAPVIEVLRKNELRSDIGKAGAETLAVILYQGPVSRAEIDKIRGVNSSFILRNLMVRGLINRSFNKEKNLYQFSATPNLLAHLGVENKYALPDFAKISDVLENFSANFSQENL